MATGERVDMRWLAEQMARVMNSHVDDRTVVSAEVDREMTCHYVMEVNRHLGIQSGDQADGAKAAYGQGNFVSNLTF